MESELPALIERGRRLVPVLVRPCLWQTRSTSLERGAVGARPAPGRSGGERRRPGGTDRAGVRKAARAGARAPRRLRHAVAAERRVAVPARSRRSCAPSAARRTRWRAAAAGATSRARSWPACARRCWRGRRRGGGHRGGAARAARAGRDRQDGASRRAGARRRGCGGIFPDGVFWVTVGEQRRPRSAAQLDLLARLGVAHPELRTASQGLEHLREALAERRCLLIVDDVWSTRRGGGVSRHRPTRRVLYTTRDPAVLDAVGAERRARRRALGRAPRGSCSPTWPASASRDLPPEADRCSRRPGESRWRWRWSARRSAGGAHAGSTSSTSSTGRRRRSSTIPTPTHSRRCRSPSPRSTGELAEAYGAWRSIPRTPPSRWPRSRATGSICGRLARGRPRRGWRCSPTASCSRSTEDGFSFHDLQRDFLLLQVEELSRAHADLLAAYRRCATGAAGPRCRTTSRTSGST